MMKIIGLKNSDGGAEPDRSSAIAGARKNNIRAGGIFMLNSLPFSFLI